ncbi:MAG: hypothetical protein K0R39_1667 [Symbiobacteriaceae bacterium]|nr:hypothetical protein [Symbiobacteriaceae bacterium]
MKEYTSDSAPSQTGLIVPVDLVAFCVGEIDAQEATNLLAGATVVYTDQVTAENQAFLGANVTRGFTDPPWQPLEQGVHLHWALPDALTTATSTDAGLDFPVVPNRWLVTRFALQGTTTATRSWIVESDALSTAQPAGQKPVTLPVKTVSPLDQNYRYVGQWVDFDQSWTEPGGTQFQDLTGAELTAVASGVVTFAAYYPNCRSVFGFTDSLSDLTVTGTAPVELMYTVTGWHSSPANDPLSTGPALEAVQSQLQWTYTDDSGATPTYTLYNGMVQQVMWNPQTTYLYHQPVQKPITADVAIGNSPAEALAAYFRNLNHPNIPLFEDLLTAFQYGLLSAFAQPTADQLASLEESLHEKEFGSQDAGQIYTIVKAGSDDDEDDSEMIDLPLQLADDLNLLNVYQQQYDLCQAHLDEFRWQLFADWYRIFQANADTQNEAYLVAYHRYGEWDALQQACTDLSNKLAAQVGVVQMQLSSEMELKLTGSPRYWQPTEPQVLLSGPDIAAPLRYGGDGRYSPDDYLICRLTNQILTGLTVGSTALTAGQYAAVTLPTPNGLPYTGDASALLAEACLLNTSLTAALTGVSAATLEAALTSLLEGQSQSTYTVTGGTAPSPVGVAWWGSANPWLPIFVEWTVDYLPLQSTVQNGQLAEYTPEFFTANYQVDPDAGGFVSYTPGSGTGAIVVDPATATFTQRYQGGAILSPSAAQGFADQLTTYLETNSDSTLQTILDQLQASSMQLHPLSGLNSSLIMRQQTLQLNVAVPNGSQYAELTEAIAPVVGDKNEVGPQFNGYFNPIRAGYLKLSLQAIDVFGQKRDVQFSQLITAESLTTYIDEKPEPSIAYLPPRLAQPSRLLYRWLAADATELEEMNPHPAASPICGWLLPNHVDGSFFLYNQQGQSLGTLSLNGNETEVEWQSAPGNNSTINQSVEEVLQYENAQLRELAIALKNGSAAFFKAFWRAVDTASGSITAPAAASDAGLAVLVGRPVALTQASLRLEVQGAPATNQGWATFAGGAYTETENGFTGVEFPVLLGDLEKLGDGLVGYFRQTSDKSDYDLTTFFSEGADPAATAGVVQPGQETLLLTPTPKLDAAEPPDFLPYTQKVLMLVDPRVAVHAAMGILPTKSISIPADQYHDALSTLEMSFLTTPVLSGAGGLALPIPDEPGYQFSWVEETKAESGGTEWSVTPDIATSTGQAVWAYTPQQLTEGWLRMNPVLLEFALLNGANQPVVTGGTTNAVTLVLTNRKEREITFNSGQLLGEGESNKGSIFYIHFGDLVAQADVAAIQFSAPGWSFQSFASSKYGQYWAATPVGSPVTLQNTETLRISVANLAAAAGALQAQVYFDYYNVDGLNDGVYAELLAVQSGSNS